MAEILAKAVSMILIILLGYGLKRAGYLSRDYFPVLSKISLNITLPCVIISKFSEFELAPAFLVFVPIGIGLNLLTNALGFAAGRKQGPQKQAYHMINLSGFNIGSFTLPFVQTFLGAQGVVAVCLFDTGNSIMCTGGTYALASAVAASGEKRSVAGFLKKLFSSVPMDVYLAMLILSLLHVRMPLLVRTFASTVGGANAFLAMLVIGVGFEWRMKREEVKETLESLLFRYGFALVLALGFYFLLPFAAEVRQAMAMVAFAPLSALCPVFTQRIGGNEALSSTLNSITIIISTLCITGLLLLFRGLGM